MRSCETKMLNVQTNQPPQNNTVYYQELVSNTPSSDSSHQQPAVDLRYIEVGDSLLGEENQLNGLGTLGGLGLNLPVNFQECEVESNELDQYLPPQTTPIHQYPPVQVTTASQWLLNRYRIVHLTFVYKMMTLKRNVELIMAFLESKSIEVIIGYMYESNSRKKMVLYK